MKSQELLEEAFDQSKYWQAIKYLADVHVEWAYESMKDMDLTAELSKEFVAANMVDMAIANVEEDIVVELSEAIKKIDIEGWLRTRRREAIALKRQGR